METTATTTNPYLRACELLGETPRPVLTDRSNKRAVSNDGHHRLTICIAAKNMIPLPDGTLKEWEPALDGKEVTYEPYWYKNTASPGFSYDGYDGWSTDTGVGARLKYRTLQGLREGVVELDEYYQDFLQ